jgi:hypothetical protein
MIERVTCRELAASGISPPGTCNTDRPPVGWVRSHIFLYAQAQSRQGARLFLLSSELEPPTLSPAGECVLPFCSGGDTLGKGRGVGVPIRTRGQLFTLAETPHPPPGPRIWAQIRWRYWSANKDDIFLWLPCLFQITGFYVVEWPFIRFVVFY